MECAQDDDAEPEVDIEDDYGTEKPTSDNPEIFGKEGSQLEEDIESGEDFGDDPIMEASIEEKKNSDDNILLRDMMDEAKKNFEKKDTPKL
ncbi:hypothetical protein Dimus_021001, partial [Dionaea muscipula]